MVLKEQRFHSIMDIYAFRVIVHDSDTCYRVLGQMHSLYKPRPGRMKDYIAIPKANGYQSLHTSMIGPHGVPVEVQIRTEDMDQMAEMGVAAHWAYKEHGGESSTTAQIRAQRWMQSLLELQQSAGSSFEFIESVKSDLFPDEIYVFTPKVALSNSCGCNAGRLRLRRAYRYRPCLRGRARRQTALPAVSAARQRPDGGNYYRTGRTSERGPAELCRELQSAR